MKYFLTPYIYTLIFCCCFSGVDAQTLTLKISAKDSTNNSFIENINFKSKHANETGILKEVDSLSVLFEKFGFLNNQLDTIIKKDSMFTARFFLGRSLKKIRIFYDKKQIAKESLEQISKTTTDTYIELPIDILQNSLNKILAGFEDKGQSFTTIQLINIVISDNLITAKLNLATSSIRTIDKVIVQGMTNFPQRFIKNHFGIRKNTKFNQKNLAKISKQLKALPFVSELKPPEVLFTNDSTYVYIYPKKKKSNTFDGLIGFFTNEATNNLKFNGYLDLTLNNLFNGGESLLLKWSNNGNDRQFFNFKLRTPYVFNSAFSPEINLNIYKQDSTFINTTTIIGLQYNINYRSKIGLSFINETSNNLRDTFVNDVSNYTTNHYGITHAYTEYTNETLFPVKFNTHISLYTGNRATSEIKTNQTKLNLVASYLWNLNTKNYVFMQSSNGILFSGNYLSNELFRIGGNNSVRGFNEESIVSSTYNIINIEYRHATNNASYLYTISDFAYVENKLDSLDQKIYSLGLGYAFNTNVGLLNLSYAIGKSDEQPFNFNNSRFHLKILSFF